MGGAHFIYIPILLVLGAVLGFILLMALALTLPIKEASGKYQPVQLEPKPCYVPCVRKDERPAHP